MRIKLFTAFTERGLERKVNTFLSNPSIKLVNACYSWCTVMITYQEVCEETK